MLEVYLFVNPLGKECYQAEKEVINIAATTDKEIEFHFIPLLNFQIVAHMLNDHSHQGCDIAAHNRLYKTCYQATLAYEAALFQGRKRGREFLLSLQEALFERGLKFSTNLVSRIVKHSSLDQEMFFEDWHSELAKQTFLTDQKQAASMHVCGKPTAVIYTNDHGVCVDEEHVAPYLAKLCEDATRPKLHFLEGENQLSAYRN